MFTLSVEFVNGLKTDIFILMKAALMFQAKCILSLCYSLHGGEEEVFTATSLGFNACSPRHFLPTSHDIGNYSALVSAEPGSLGVLLPLQLGVTFR